MYKNILVPMALNHGVAEQALGIARKLLSDGGKITALHVYEAPQGSVGAYLDEQVVRESYARAKSLLDDRIKNHPDVAAQIVKGHSGRSIIDVAEDIGADCIVLGSHKPGLSDYFLGSTAARVVRHAGCAVHVMRPQA